MAFNISKNDAGKNIYANGQHELLCQLHFETGCDVSIPATLVLCVTDYEPHDENSDEEWDALLEKHAREKVYPAVLPDPKDPLGLKVNKLSDQASKRLYWRINLLWHVMFNYWPVAASFPGRTRVR